MEAAGQKRFSQAVRGPARQIRGYAEPAEALRLSTLQRSAPSSRLIHSESRTIESAPENARDSPPAPAELIPGRFLTGVEAARSRR